MFESLFGGKKNDSANDPATESQKRYAKALGVKGVEALTKEEASAAIEKKKAAQSRRNEAFYQKVEKRLDALEKKVGSKSAKKAAKRKKK